MPSSGTNVAQFDILAKKLRGMSRKMAEQYMTPIMQDAAQPVIQATKGNIAPHNRTGGLERSIGVVVRIKPKRGLFLAIIGARYGFATKSMTGQKIEPTHYHHLLEYGTGPHIEAWTNLDGRRRQYVHKGAAAYPTLRPAWDGKKASCVEILRNALASCIRDLAEEKVGAKA
jgi:hypothetical protein